MASKKQPKKSHKKLNAFFLSFGFILIFFSFFIRSRNSQNLSFDTEIKAGQLAQEQPVRIYIPSVGVSLPVFETEVKNGVWEINKTGASSLKNAPNLILYGHNSADRLGPLKKIKNKDEIILFFANGEKVSYEVDKITEVLPSAVDSLVTNDKNKIILYTCSGILDTRRLVIQAAAN